MAPDYQKEIVQHIIRNLLDVQLLRIVGAGPIWGYRISKRFEVEFDVKIRHETLYSTLGLLEKKGFVDCVIELKGGRQRKVYTITTEGKQYLQIFYSIMQGQQVKPS